MSILAEVLARFLILLDGVLRTWVVGNTLTASGERLVADLFTIEDRVIEGGLRYLAGWVAELWQYL